MFECEYCKNSFKTALILRRHKDNAKKCLKLRGIIPSVDDTKISSAETNESLETVTNETLVNEPQHAGVDDSKLIQVTNDLTNMTRQYNQTNNDVKNMTKQ